MDYLPPYSPLDRRAHERGVEPLREVVDIEKPIFSMSELGTTFVENDPTGRFRNVLQSAQAAIRSGAGTLQLIMMTPPGQPIGGRFKAYGAEVREAMRELAKASEVKVRGIEMPTAMNNLSGWDMQRNRFSEEIRREYLDEIRDGIRFAAETMGGGGIDIVSWEYGRGINDAAWNKDASVTLPSGKKAVMKSFVNAGEPEYVQAIDTVTGTVTQHRKGEVLYLAKDPLYGDKFLRDEKGARIPLLGDDGKQVLDDKGKPVFKELGLQPDGEIKLKAWSWKNFEDDAKRLNIDPELIYVREQIETSLSSYEGLAARYANDAKTIEKNITLVSNQMKNLSGEQLDDAKERLESFKKEYAHMKEAAEGQKRQADDLRDKKDRIVPVKDYALDRSASSYAEAGVWAHQETRVHGPRLDRPIHVGPELGWPTYYGSHPEEWVDLIRAARGKMVKLLTQEFRTVKEGKSDVLVDVSGKPLTDKEGKFVTSDMFKGLSGEERARAENPYFVKGLSEKEASEEAKRHIKGMFDTSHLGMFLQHFRPDLPWEQRVKEFNKWYMEKVDWLAAVNKKEDIIGGVQIVDTQTGAHSHLPPGQGVLPLVQAMTKLKKDGNLQGFLVSEGHEEEKFGEGRILLKTWEQFGAHVNRDYFSGGAPLQWNRSLPSNFVGRTYSPTFMYGAYAPSNEYKLWSEIPFE